MPGENENHYVPISGWIPTTDIIGGNLIDNDKNVTTKQELTINVGINQEPDLVKQADMEKSKCQHVADKAINTDITSDHDIFKIPTAPCKIGKKVKAARNNAHNQNTEHPQNSTRDALANFVDKIPVNKVCADTQDKGTVTYKCSVCESSPVFENMAVLLVHTFQQHTRKRVLVHCHACQCYFSYCEKVMSSHSTGTCKKVKLAN